MALPANVSFGTVTGRFLTATADSPTDTDRDPEGIAASDLTIRFSPNVTPAVVRDASASPPTIFALAEVPASVNPSGDLIGADGQPGIRLVATTGTTIDPSGWTWKVTLSSPTFPALSFSFALDPGQSIDLATVVQVPASPGATLAAWLQAVADANAAADRAEAAAAGGGASDADIAELVADPATETGAAIAARYVSKRLPRRSSLPGYTAMPTLKPSAATLTAGVANASSTIAGSALVNPWDTTAFSYTGGIPTFRGSAWPRLMFFSNGNDDAPAAGIPGDVYPSGKTTPSPWGVEFDFDSTDGKFEVFLNGSGGHARLLVDGAYVTAGDSFVAPPDGNMYLHLVTLPAAGTYRIRFEFDLSVGFGGIRALPTNSLRAVPTRPNRCIVVGDSYTEPTVIDSGVSCSAGDGWAQRFGYLTGWDVWSAGSGGTGYVAPGVNGRVAIPDRMSDITRNDPDVVIFAAGINDTGHDPAAVGAAALTAFQAVKTANPDTVIVALSPFWPRGYSTYPANLLAQTDAIRASAATVGAIWLDLLRFPAPLQGVDGSAAVPTPGTLTAAAGEGSTTFEASVSYPTGTIVQIGTDANAEAVITTAAYGSGPYTHNVAAFQRPHLAGDAVIPFGGSYMTGTGRQGSPAGNGTADRYTGSDSTHPTVAGHSNIARTVLDLLAAQLPA